MEEDTSAGVKDTTAHKGPQVSHSEMRQAYQPGGRVVIETLEVQQGDDDGDEDEEEEELGDCPRDLECPICYALMTDPVLGSDGFSYQRSALQQHIDFHAQSKSRAAQHPQTSSDDGDVIRGLRLSGCLTSTIPPVQSTSRGHAGALAPDEPSHGAVLHRQPGPPRHRHGLPPSQARGEEGAGLRRRVWGRGALLED